MIVCPFEDLKRYIPVIPGLKDAMDAIDAMKGWEVGTTQLSGGNRIMAMEGTTGGTEGRQCEAHRLYLDLQYIVEGEETVGWAPLDKLTLSGTFSTEKDIGMYDGAVDFMRIPAGNCYVVFPEDGHMPGVSLDGPHNYKKMVVKLRV